MKKLAFSLALVVIVFISISSPVFADEVPPVVTLDDMSKAYPLDYSEIELEGTVTDIGSSTVVTVGFCWNTTGEPTISGSKTATAVSISSVPTTFLDSATDLEGYTTYYFKSYATNDGFTSYSAEQSIRTRCSLGVLGECVDRAESYFEPVPENASKYVGNGWKCEETDNGTSFIYLSAAQMLTTKSARVYSYRVTYSGTFVGTEVIDYADFNAGQEAGNSTVVRVHEHSSYGGGDPLYAVVSSPDWGGTAGNPYMSTFSVTNTGTISVAYDTQSVAIASNHGYFGSDAWYIDEGYVGTIQSRWYGPVGGGWDDCSVFAQVIDVLVDGTINGAVDGLTIMSSYEWNPEYFVRPKLFKITGDQPNTPDSNEGGYGRWGVTALYGVAPYPVTWGTFWCENTGGVPDLQSAKYVPSIAGISGEHTVNSDVNTPQRIYDDYWAFMMNDDLWTIEITQGGTVSATPYDVIDWTDEWLPENNKLLYVGGNRYMSLSSTYNNSTIRIAGFDINSPDLSLDMVAQDDSVTGMINYTRGTLSVLTDGTPHNIYHFVGMNGASPPVITGFSFITYVPATVDTTGYSNVTSDSAIGYGIILHAGWSVPTVAGICWSKTNQYPTVTSGSFTATGGVYPISSTWSGTMDDLETDTLYYYRAYATSTNGTGYGPTGTFTTLAGPPTLTTEAPTDIVGDAFTANGTITSIGAGSPTFRGFVWNLTGTPTTSDYGWYEEGSFDTGAYSGPITGVPSTVIYIRAFATNAMGTGYGNEIEFGIAEPIVYTLGVTNVGTSTASGSGYLVSFGASMVNRVGICWSSSGTPTTADNVCYKEVAIGIGNYFCDMTGMFSNTVYYVRAYATNANFTGYGDVINFMTVPNFTDNTMYLDFEPTSIIPPSSPGTITDVSSYENNASYILADMIDGVTVYASIASTAGNFYPEYASSDLGEILIVPPQSGMEQQGDASLLPLYDLFSESAANIGVDVAILYTVATLSIAMGVGFLFFLISGSIFVALIGMTVLFAGFFSTGVMPFWILIFFVAFSFGIVFLYRQA